MLIAETTIKMAFATSEWSVSVGNARLTMGRLLFVEACGGFLAGRLPSAARCVLKYGKENAGVSTARTGKMDNVSSGICAIRHTTPHSFVIRATLSKYDGEGRPRQWQV